MKITAYRLRENPLELVPGNRKREWMDNTVYSYAYRCLPLSIANEYGWAFLAPCDFRIEWRGGDHQKTISFEYESDRPFNFLSSIFGSGVVTFHTEYLIRTDPGWNTYVTGAPNFGLPWYTSLDGIVETWWLNFPFTVNWKLHGPGSWWFNEGDPIGFIFPVPANPQIQTELKDISDDPEIQTQFSRWSKSRRLFNDASHQAFESGCPVGSIIPDVPSTHWQKTYYQGRDMDGNRQPEHQTKIKFPEFKRSET